MLNLIHDHHIKKIKQIKGHIEMLYIHHNIKFLIHKCKFIEETDIKFITSFFKIIFLEQTKKLNLEMLNKLNLTNNNS